MRQDTGAVLHAFSACRRLRGIADFMLDIALRDKAKGLLAPSARGNVPPFMVMDVMAAAARIEAAGAMLHRNELIARAGIAASWIVPHLPPLLQNTGHPARSVQRNARASWHVQGRISLDCAAIRRKMTGNASIRKCPYRSRARV